MKVKVVQSCLTLCHPMDCPWNSLGQNTGVGSLSLLQGIFPTQDSNRSLLHCTRILYQLSLREAHQAPPSLGFSTQEHWSGLPFPSPMQESEKWKWSRSVVRLLATPWTAAYQAPPSMGFSRQEDWSGLPLPSPSVTLGLINSIPRYLPWRNENGSPHYHVCSWHSQQH